MLDINFTRLQFGVCVCVCAGGWILISQEFWGQLYILFPVLIGGIWALSVMRMVWKISSTFNKLEVKVVYGC